MEISKINNLYVLSCRLCGSVNVQLLFKLIFKLRNYTVINCEDCDVMQTVEHYDDISPDYIGLTDDMINKDRIWCQGEHKLPAFYQWLAQMKCRIEKPNYKLSLLDIGCGTGGFLRFAQENGLNVYGFDASIQQTDYARKTFPMVRQAITINDYLELIGEPNRKFDIITLWDVIEHVREPNELLLSIRNALHPGGNCFITTPNGKLMLFKKRIYSIFGKVNYFEWIPWEHVFYFSPKSLRKYLEISGFNNIETGSMACYPRPLSSFEITRRLLFTCTRYVPKYAPQLYSFSQAPRDI